MAMAFPTRAVPGAGRGGRVITVGPYDPADPEGGAPPAS